MNPLIWKLILSVVGAILLLVLAAFVLAGALAGLVALAGAA